MPVPVSTAPPAPPYEILDTIFAADTVKRGLLSKTDPNKVFDRVKNQLGKIGERMGGDAVVSCRFEYQHAIEAGVLGSKGIVEILAYGTVVRF